MTLNLEPLTLPCNKDCGDESPCSSTDECEFLSAYIHELKGRQEMARAIVGYITRLNKKAKREHTGITIGALRIMIEESLKESGVEV